MSNKKSFIHKMVFVCMFIVLFSSITPSISFASAGSGFVSDCLEDGNLEKCSNNNEDAESDEPESASPSIGVLDYLKILLALVFVVGLLVFILKFINRKNMAYQQNSLIKNLGGLSLGAQKSVQLLQIGNRIYLVGVGENIQLIKEIQDEQEMNQILEIYLDKQQDMSTSPFIIDFLRKKSQKRDGKNKETVSFNNLFNSKLDEIKKERSDELEGWKEKEKNKHE